ncbi:MAG: hypothetical protein GYB64_20685 [Chloroflexi bacterium]|nr:hypothetical protein [Chloroflexota bacterium]
MGTYAGGFQGFVDDLAAHLREMGVTIHLGTPVERIAFTDAGLTVTVDGEAVPADQVLSTTSPGLMRRLTPDLPPAYAKQLADLKSIGALSMILALDRPLMTDGTYWLNLPAAHTDKTANPFPYLALVEHTNYQDPAHYGGDHIVYLGDYLAPDHPHFALSDEAIADLYLPSLQRVRPDFSREWIRDWWVFRAPYTQPVPTLNHSQNIPPIRTGLPGVYLANMSQVYPWDRGTNYAVEIGRQAAALMLADGPPE